MAKNGCSECFPTILLKKSGINSEKPKMCIPKLLKPFQYKKTGRNLEWPKIGILNLFKPFWCKKIGRNLEWPKLGIPNLFKSVMVSNGLESNEICTFLGF